MGGSFPCLLSRKLHKSRDVTKADHWLCVSAVVWYSSSSPGPAVTGSGVQVPVSPLHRPLDVALVV